MSMDYMWLVEAAGQDKQRLAQLSVLLAGAGMMLAQTETAENTARTVEELLAMREAMHRICSIMGAEKEMTQTVKDIWGR